jgi:RHS repeat-associated protein
LPSNGPSLLALDSGSNNVYYLLKDLLGMASVVKDSSGNILGEERYYPYGEIRFTIGTTYTDKLFTSQRDVGLGIYHYGARFRAAPPKRSGAGYSPKLGRFLSADTIVPGAANPQAWNRYSYVLGNPLKYIDPSGHGQCQTEEDCADMGTTPMGTGGSDNTPSPQPEDDIDPHDDDDIDPNPNHVVCGLHGYYSPSCPGWHYYSNADNPNLVCPAYLHCTEAQMMDYLYRFVFPGQDPNFPASDLDTNLVWVGIMPLGHIQTKVDGLMITNFTQSDHLMYDGQVVRQAIQNSDGSWSIVTTGTGNNKQIPFVPVGHSGVGHQQMQSLTFAPINAFLGPGAFNDLDQAMLNYIVEHQ